MPKFLVRATVRQIDYFEKTFDTVSADAAQAQAALEWGQPGVTPDGWIHEEAHHTEITFDDVMVMDEQDEPV